MSLFKNVSDLPTLCDGFLHCIDEILPRCKHTRVCKTISDRNWIEIGLRRMLSLESSGRGFLQELSDTTNYDVATGHFFESLKSDRRLRLCAEFNSHIVARIDEQMKTEDPYASIQKLRDYDIYAGDGHYHKAACFDPRKGHKNEKYGTQHFYAVNMRSLSMRHITLADVPGEKKKEHDMHAIKRCGQQKMRMGAPAGRKVLWVWDRAAIDGQLWQKWKMQYGIYFVSRTKENMTLEKSGDIPYDKTDPINAGVIAYELVSCANALMRCVTYRCPDTGKEFQYISSLTTMEPGVIVALYKARWDIEKIYDEVKNKFMEKKSWASSATAKCMQAEFICILHNLTLALENHIETDHGVMNEREDIRRSTRLRKQKEACTLRQQNSCMPALMSTVRKVSQRTKPFVRWLRNNFDRQRPWEQILDRLVRAYRA